MGYVIYFESKHKILHIVHHGGLTESLVLDVIRAVEKFQQTHELEIGILDFSQIDLVDTSAEFVRRLGTRPPHFRDYFLVAPQTVQYGFSRMFQAFRGGEECVQVVRSLDEVWERLAFTPSEFELVASSNT